MKRILFICLGNICRSPMAEAIMKDLVAQAGKSDQFEIASAAISPDEWKEHIHPKIAELLDRNGIPYDKERYATQMKFSDYAYYDLIIVMDRANILGVLNYAGGKDTQGKIHMLLEYTGENRDIDDPWFTHEFTRAYKEVTAGCKGLCRYLGI